MLHGCNGSDFTATINYANLKTAMPSEIIEIQAFKKKNLVFHKTNMSLFVSNKIVCLQLTGLFINWQLQSTKT